MSRTFKKSPYKELKEKKKIKKKMKSFTEGDKFHPETNKYGIREHSSKLEAENANRSRKKRARQEEKHLINKLLYGDD